MFKSTPIKIFRLFEFIRIKSGCYDIFHVASRKYIIGFLLVFSAVPTSATPTSCTPKQDLSELLRQYDESLLLAVHRGDHETWEKLTTPDFSYIEAGEVYNREAFLKDIVNDGQKPLAMQSYKLHRIGDTAIVVHVDEVPSNPMNTSRPNGRYIMTETWQCVHGKWKLRIVHIEPIRTDPPAITLMANQLDEIVGKYKAGAFTFVVQRDGNRLIGLRSKEPAVELMPETRDVFFVPGNTRSKRIFLRDPVTGSVTGFIRRDENSDILYHRVAE
jgi:hypothetical protein